MKKIKEKGAFLRTCSGCGKRTHKNGLIRIVKSPDNEICADKSGQLPGRGAYLCKDYECLKKAVKSARITKILRAKVSDDIYKELEYIIGNIENG